MSATPDLRELRWRKASSSSQQGGNCIEVAALDEGGHAVRDSKRPEGAMLFFTSGQWRAFVSGVKGGDLG